MGPPPPRGTTAETGTQDAGTTGTTSTTDASPPTEVVERICEGNAEVRDDETFADVRTCTSITGDLEIYAPDLVDLDGLEALTELGGDVWIYHTHPDADFHGRA